MTPGPSSSPPCFKVSPLIARTDEGLDKGFGALIDAEGILSAADLRQPSVVQKLRQLWLTSGVLIIRGLVDLTADDLAAISAHFGQVEEELETGREHAKFAGLPVMRIGNAKGPDGKSICMPSGDQYDTLPPDGNCQYRPADKRPVWHTDATFRENPPAGSALFCRQNPPEGGITCFADMKAAYRSLPIEEQKRLEGFECVCSLPHHDAKIHARRSDYPKPTEALRVANPPRRVPLVLQHPETGTKALYGWNSSTCCIVPKGEALQADKIAKLEMSAEEDDSVRVWQDLLQRVTAPEFTVAWRWKVGDLAIWDNRSTMHCATGFDHEKYVREMWRTTILPDDSIQLEQATKKARID
mmetsp:Transcript_7027/g.11320  ORF Transcript_7027/g.11320 Transcript_7027/m.11320 type:complete len:356 (-) Transcript_7027:32-1099(-)